MSLYYEQWWYSIPSWGIRTAACMPVHHTRAAAFIVTGMHGRNFTFDGVANDTNVRLAFSTLLLPPSLHVTLPPCTLYPVPCPVPRWSAASSRPVPLPLAPNDFPLASEILCIMRALYLCVCRGSFASIGAAWKFEPNKQGLLCAVLGVRAYIETNRIVWSVRGKVERKASCSPQW